MFCVRLLFTQTDSYILMKSFINNFVLKSFHKINLSSKEREIADEAVNDKYIPSIQKSLFLSILLIPATLLLDTSIILSILIPITMVAGTAWFSVSLASMKEKFERFGLELTLNLFTAFVLSLLMLFLLSVTSMTKFLWADFISNYSNNVYLLITAAFLGIFVVWYLMWSVFTGSLKYDMNDSMLAGQNEAAELFFKRSLSLLYQTSDLLRSNPASDQVANYSLGVAFFEIFSYMKEIGIDKDSLSKSLERTNQLIMEPSMKIDKADTIATDLLGELINDYIKKDNIKGLLDNKSYQAIRDELSCLKNNKKEDRAMIDLRISVALQEIATLLDSHGETLFI